MQQNGCIWAQSSVRRSRARLPGVLSNTRFVFNRRQRKGGEMIPTTGGPQDERDAHRSLVGGPAADGALSRAPSPRPRAPRASCKRALAPRACTLSPTSPALPPAPSHGCRRLRRRRRLALPPAAPARRPRRPPRRCPPRLRSARAAHAQGCVLGGEDGGHQDGAGEWAPPAGRRRDVGRDDGVRAPRVRVGGREAERRGHRAGVGCEQPEADMDLGGRDRPDLGVLLRLLVDVARG